MDYRSRVAAAVAIVFSSATLEGCAAQVAAAKERQAALRGATERCFGVAKAGANDCRTHAHVCAGWANTDRDRTAFVYVPAGTCTRLTGGQFEESD
jgi:uncharacterized membrane protein